MGNKKYRDTERSSIDARSFSASDFVFTHADSYVLFLSGSWNYETRLGIYRGLLCYGYHRKNLYRKVPNIKSGNATMLQCVLDACEMIKKHDADIYVFPPTHLGFKTAEKGKGANIESLKAILRMCKQKNLRLHEIVLQNGASGCIKTILDAPDVV